MNTFGEKLRLTTFGESHGPAIGGIIDGFPSGFKINFEELYSEIAKRSPGNSILTSLRKEGDKPEFLSGISPEGITYGTPIGFIIRNTDTKNQDYSDLKDKYRPNHADFTYDAKYGIRDHLGGGRASARETANWVVAGALANQFLEKNYHIKINSLLTSVGEISYTREIIKDLGNSPSIDKFEIPAEVRSSFENEIIRIKKEGDSIGGIVSCMITGVKAGIGNPIFDKLQSKLAHAMLSINAAKGFEYGLGFESSQKRGSEILDNFVCDIKGQIYTKTNFSGGIQGGITNGMPIYFNVAFKPTPSISQEIESVDKEGRKCLLRIKGRHDPCVAVRAVPVVKALTALVIADILL